MARSLALQARSREFKSRPVHSCYYPITIQYEAHSSQSGSMSAKMNMVLGGDYGSNADIEDKIDMRVEGRKMLKNASYYTKIVI